MIFLPIVSREMRVASRKWKSYGWRISMPLVITLICALMWFTLRQEENDRDLGRALFIMMTFACFLFTALAGAGLTADCISSEKREGTLGLLFLTDLRGYDVVLGKLISNSVMAFSGLLAMLPVLLVPIVMGGVEAQMVLKTAASLVVAMLLFLSIGMVCSSLFHSDRYSTSLAVGVVLLLGLVFPMVVSLGGSGVKEGREAWLAAVMFHGSPTFTLIVAMTSLLGGGRGFPGMPVWEHLIAVQLGLSVFLLLAAGWLTERLWQTRATTRQSRWRRVLAWLIYGPRWFRQWLYRRWLDRDPVTWIILRPWLKYAAAWAVALFPAALFFYWRVLESTNLDYLWLAWLALGLFKIAVGLEASQGLAQDLRSGELEMLLATPWTSEEILRSHGRALRHLFLWPGVVVLVVVTAVVADWVWLRAHHREAIGEVLLVGAMYVGGLVVAAFDVRALVWTGLNQGIACPKARTASSNTIIFVLALPWLGVFLVAAVVSLGCWLLRLEDPMNETAIFGLWLFWSLINSVLWAKYSRADLLKEFRSHALQRYQPPKPSQFWTALGRQFGLLTRQPARK